MRLYDFDGIGAELNLLPLAVRRALDLAGLKLGRQGFLSLPQVLRAELAALGSVEEVDLERAREILRRAKPAPQPIPREDDPDPRTAPDFVLTALGPERPLPEKVWQALSSLDRYSLAKTCSKNRQERVTAAYAEIVGESARSTHLAADGSARMVRVSQKDHTVRSATAESIVGLGPRAMAQLRTGETKKGDVLSTARLAGILATKKTGDLIPLCHPLALTHAEVRFEPLEETSELRILCQVECVGPTGVEMEAMVGASVAALTVYDMLKSTHRAMSVGPTRLLLKSGGRSGTFDRSLSEDP